MTDLNTLLAPGYTKHLYYANDINDFGEITGQSLDEASGESRTFVAVPSATLDVGDVALTAGADEQSRPGVVLPEDARRTLLQQLGLGRTDL